jgi:hypothetical protein
MVREQGVVVSRVGVLGRVEVGELGAEWGMVREHRVGMVRESGMVGEGMKRCRVVVVVVGVVRFGQGSQCPAPGVTLGAA